MRSILPGDSDLKRVCNCKRDVGYHYHRVIVIWSILCKLYRHCYRMIVSLSPRDSNLKHTIQYVLSLSPGDSDVKNKSDDLLEYVARIKQT